MELPEKFLQVLQNEGVVSVVTWISDAPHITNTWNSYLRINKDNEILIPAAGFTHAEEDLKQNNQVLLTAGAREVEGKNGYQGTGFRIEGYAKLIDSGEDYELMHEAYPFIRKVLVVTPDSAKQLL